MKNFAMGLLLSSFGTFLGTGTAAAATTEILPGPEINRLKLMLEE